MKPQHKSAILKLFVLLVFLPLPIAAVTVPFSGFYEIRNVTDLGPEVRFDLRLQLINHTGNDVSGAHLGVYEGGLSNDTIHSWDSLVLFDNEPASLSATITVTRSILASWRRSGGPRLLLRYADAQGNSKTALVRLISQRVLED